MYRIPGTTGSSGLASKARENWVGVKRSAELAVLSGRLKVLTTAVCISLSFASVGGHVTNAHAAGVTSPAYVRTIGHPGHADLYPSGLDVDSAGNVYIADTGNDRVEKYPAGSNVPAWSVGVRGGTTNGNPIS